MRPRLVTGEESRADSGRCGTGVQDGGQRLSGGDATGSDHGNSDGGYDLGEEGAQWRRAAEMPARFDTLGNHDVASGVSGAQRLIEGADLPERQGAPGVDAVHDDGIRITPKHVDNACVGGRELELVGPSR